MPRTANRLATQAARQWAEMGDPWQAPPSRAAQRRALVRGVEPRWAEWAVPRPACERRFWNKKTKRPAPRVCVTTDLGLSAPWIVRHDAERPEIEQDAEQRKSGGWQLKKLRATRDSAIVFSGLTVVLSDRLSHLLANTQAGTRCANKTRQAIALEQLRTHRTHSMGYAGGYVDIFEPLSFVQMVWQLSPPVHAHLCTWLAEHRNQIHKRE